MTLKAWCNEPLEDHLLRVGDVAFGSAGEEAMVREVRSVHTAVAKRLGIDVEAARRLVAVAAYLHDVGKAAEPYQRIIMLREREGCRGLSLPGHEAWSAWVAYYTIRPLGDKLARVASAAIILHHMPRWSIEDIVTTASKIRPTLGDVDTMFTLAERGFQRYGLEYDVASHALARYDYLRFRDVVKLLSWLKLSTEEMAAAELLRYAIALADNLA